MKYLSALLLFSAPFLSYSQESPAYTVHEWGTFTAHYTSRGIPYTDLYKTANEPVPAFVYKFRADSQYVRIVTYSKYDLYTVGFPELENVTIKMETPVLYFYSKKAIDNLIVDVSFKQGSIGEFFPMPFQHETLSDVQGKAYIKNNKPALDLGRYNGNARWSINVLAPADTQKPTEPDNTLPNVWLAPRKTSSNMIECGGIREKYIFYRGIGGFENPVLPHYTQSGNLVVQNLSGEDLPYVMVYEMTSEGERRIWGEGMIGKAESKVFEKASTGAGERRWLDVHRAHFIKELEKAGLYHDEAEAMLNTWDQNYFGKPGVKVFWIVPRKFTDKILPLSLSLTPEHLERVMIGRTEIDDFIPSFWNLQDMARKDDEDLRIYPNPSQDGISILASDNEKVTFALYDFSGRLISSGEMELAKGNNKLPSGILDKGNYSLSLTSRNITKHLRMVIY
jgi:hypothetical protein